MEPMNYYEVLGVSSSADDVTIKRAFRRLSLELHPDKTKAESSRYSCILKAYKVLSDSQERKLYDLSLRNHHKTRNESNSACEIDNESRVSVIEVGATKRGSEEGGRQDSLQNDLELIRKTVVVSLGDCYQGTTLPVKIERNVNGNLEEAVLYIDIPRGTDDGEILECIGQGNVKGRQRSDVRVKVIVDSHPLFHREGLNLTHPIELSLKEAMCGFTREIEHLDGKKYKVTSEPGKIVQPGSVRTIVGKGFIRNGCMKTGNLNIVFDVTLPEHLSKSDLKKLEMLLP